MLFSKCLLTLAGFAVSMIASLAYHCSFAFYGAGLKAASAMNSGQAEIFLASLESYDIILYMGLGGFFGLG